MSGDRERIVIVGAGKAGAQLATSLRGHGSTAEIVMFDDEGTLPYDRPPLSKDFLAGDVDHDSLALHAEDFYREHDIDLRLGSAVVAIDPVMHAVTLRDGQTLGYDRLVIATGSVPRSLPMPGADLDGVLGLRSAADADRLRALLEQQRDVVVIGGGYLGLEVAALAATRYGSRVTLIEALPRLLARTALPQTAAYALRYHTELGVTVLLDTVVSRLIPGEDGRVAFVETRSGERISAGVVFYGIGVIARDELAAAAGLATANGVLVDSELRTSGPDIWAIGDCCEFPSFHFGSSVRLESIQNAVDQAEHLAESLIGGAGTTYRAVPWFWSDQAEMKIQSVGFVRDHDEAVVIGSPEMRKFTVLAFNEGLLVGADSVNSPADHLAARRLYADDDIRRALTPEVASAPDFDLRAWVKGRRSDRDNG